MQYMFSCLVLGDPQCAQNYLQEADVFSDETCEENDLNCHLTQGENEVDITFEIAALTDIDYEDLFPITDCFLYFLNPNDSQELEIFEEIYKTLHSLDRNIPGLIIFRDPETLIHGSSIQLLSWVWENYPYEALIANFGTANRLRFIMELLSGAIIDNTLLLNYHTCWMQEPILQKRLGDLITQKQWESAAFICDKLSRIHLVQNNQEWQIWAERAALLYEKAEYYLKAADCIKEFNPIDAQSFKTHYVNNLLTEADHLKELNKFGSAAIKYQNAGNWAHFELKNTDLVHNCYKKAINAWIYAHENQNALELLNKFPHDEMVNLLEVLTEKITNAADQLMNQEKFEEAKAQLYLCFQRYQKVGLFDSLKVLANKTVQILKEIIEKLLNEKDVYTAELAIDELTNIWESYSIKSTNIDNYLFYLGSLFLEKHDFKKVEHILPRIESGKLQAKLSDLRVEKEEQLKQENRADQLADLKKSYEILESYLLYENSLFQQKIDTLTRKVENLQEQGQYTLAEQKIRQQFRWFVKLKRKTMGYQLILVLLDLYIDSRQLKSFLENIQTIPEYLRKSYIQTRFNQLISLFRETQHHFPLEKYEEYLLQVIKLYRNHLLYDNSKLLAIDLIEFLKDQALRAAERATFNSISKSLDLLARIQNVASSYVSDSHIDLDRIYAKIVQFYINHEELKEARKYNEKIIDQSIAAPFYSTIDSIETEISQKATDKVRKKEENKIFTEQLSQLKNQAGDQKIASTNFLRMRSGLKRRYFEEPLNLITQNEYMQAAQQYFEVAESLAETKKYELAGLSTSIAALLYFLIGKPDHLKTHLDRFREKIGTRLSYFEGTYPVQILEYLLKMIEIQNQQNFTEALSLYQNLALFPEEKELLNTLLGQKIHFETILQTDPTNSKDSEKSIPNNYQIIINQIPTQLDLLTRRKTLVQRYWSKCADLFTHQKYEQVSVEYLNQVKPLLDRQALEFAITSTIMGFLSILRSEEHYVLYQKFEKFIFRMEKIYSQFSEHPTLVLLDLFLQYWKHNNAKEMLADILQAYKSKLPLLDWEVAYVTRLINVINADNMDQFKTSSFTSSSGKSSSTGGGSDSLLHKQLTVLNETVANIAEELAQLHEKRSKMIRTYYKDIFQALDSNDYASASKKYIRLAKRMARRNDYNAASLMILLSVLVKKQAGKTPATIKEELDTIMNKLGIVKKILDEHFGVKIAYFTLDVLRKSDAQIQSKLLILLEKLPLLDPEFSLLENLT